MRDLRELLAVLERGLKTNALSMSKWRPSEEVKLVSVKAE
jgi:hypothetical protein